MSIIGIGTDIVQKARIESLWQRYGERFATRILSDEEQSIFNNHTNHIAFLAKRFAAKEAVAKALGTGIGQHLAFTDISITNDKTGKPMVSLLGKAKAFIAELGIGQMLITLSDEKEYAVAFVVIERPSPGLRPPSPRGRGGKE